mmetsp:Transcript_34468/g.90271  ORF Transcript_34468/g.90271 Transcript_34468/m.90271 type:complete len:216 (-) Transcript_34468:150-797(-)
MVTVDSVRPATVHLQNGREAGVGAITPRAFGAILERPSARRACTRTQKLTVSWPPTIVLRMMGVLVLAAWPRKLLIELGPRKLPPAKPNLASGEGEGGIVHGEGKSGEADTADAAELMRARSSGSRPICSQGPPAPPSSSIVSGSSGCLTSNSTSPLSFSLHCASTFSLAPMDRLSLILRRYTLVVALRSGGSPMSVASEERLPFTLDSAVQGSR